MRETVAKQLEDIVKAHTLNSWVDAMTDQLDVYIKGRKVAIYMPLAQTDQPQEGRVNHPCSCNQNLS